MLNTLFIAYSPEFLSRPEVFRLPSDHQVDIKRANRDREAKGRRPIRPGGILAVSKPIIVSAEAKKSLKKSMSEHFTSQIFQMFLSPEWQDIADGELLYKWKPISTYNFPSLSNSTSIVGYMLDSNQAILDGKFRAELKRERTPLDFGFKIELQVNPIFLNMTAIESTPVQMLRKSYKVNYINH